MLIRPEMDTTDYDIEVELTMLPYEESGRDLPILSGYRNHFHIEKLLLTSSFVMKGGDELWPGETAHVYVRFACPELLLGKIHPGTSFELHEGYRPIGKGIILAILNFEQHVEESIRREGERSTQLADPNRMRIPPSWERPHHRLRKKKGK
jgi:translation elongation factor EF-Tu-like GTPase